MGSLLKVWDAKKYHGSAAQESRGMRIKMRSSIFVYDAELLASVLAFAPASKSAPTKPIRLAMPWTPPQRGTYGQAASAATSICVAAQTRLHKSGTPP
jgi:hypothetical protein